MFARMLTLHARLEKKPELAAKIFKNVIPIVKHLAGPVDVLVLHDEVELDRIVVMSLWKT